MQRRARVQRHAVGTTPGGEGTWREAALPLPVRELAVRLHAASHEAFLVGGCVRDLVRGLTPADWDLATSASPPQVLALFPRAIPIGLRHGTVMVPTPCGPVDVTTFRGGGGLETDLSHRDFTLNAMAVDVQSGTLIDPHQGRADLERSRLRAVGRATDRFAEDPLRALRAARLAACLGLTPDADVEAALAGARPGLARVAAERIQHELVRLLLAEDPTRGLDMLRRAGIEADLVPGARTDAHAVAAALPPDLDLRLAAWLRGTSAPSILARLRFSRDVQRRVERLLQLHPVDAQAGDSRKPALRRLLRRAGEIDVEALVALRGAELQAGDDAGREDAVAQRARLAALREALACVRADGRLALHRRDLALGGREVMDVLGCAPGRRVGAALEYLSECILEDPECNTRERLRTLLEAWSRNEPGAAC